MNFLQNIGAIITTVALSIGGVFGIYEKPITPQDIQSLSSQVEELQQNLGATIPKVVAKFETSLASGISASDTSMTLVKGTDAAGNSLSGYTCFAIDEGSTSEEFVCGTASSTSITSMIRGIDPVDGDTEVTALKKSHRRGASVKITDHPSLSIALRILNGDETVPNKLSYDSSVTTSSFNNTQQIVSKGYVDNLTFVGTPPASQTVAGATMEATKSQIANGTATSSYLGNDYKLFAPASAFNTTSSATNTVPVTGTNGKLSQGFLDLTQPFTFSGGVTSTATTTISGTLNVSGNTTFSGTVTGISNTFGDGTDGDVTISTTTTLTSDKFYNNLTVNNGVTLNAGGYKIYVKGTLTNAGTISNNGGNGGNASGATGGSAGTSASVGSTGATVNGVAGVNGGATDTAGTAGTSVGLSLGSVGVAGGAVSGGGTAGGSAGTISSTDLLRFGYFGVTKNATSSIVLANTTTTYALFSAFQSASSTYGQFGIGSGSGSGAGGGASSGTGGGGGGSGASGGFIYIIANSLVNTGTISANGGNGGNGGDASGSSNCRGGGGGGAGSGGIILIAYNTYSGSGTLSVAGGTGGTGSAGTGVGVAGNSGSNGNVGKIYRVVFSY